MAIKTAYIAAAGTAAQDVTLNGPGVGISVVNLDGQGVVAFRLDGTTAAAADENWFVGASAGAFRTVSNSKWPVTVSVYASGSTRVSIEVVDQ